MSPATVAVLRALASGARYGFDVMDSTGLASGTVYPILGRLERRALVRARWEDPELPRTEGRPPRKYYSITAEGHEALRVAIERFRRLTGDGGPVPEVGG